MSLTEKLDKIRSPKLQNQKDAAVVLQAVESTLRDQGQEFTATAYFAVLLALLGQAISAENGIVNKQLATSVVYLLDLVTSHVPAPLLRSKFSQILSSLSPALVTKDIEAPFLRPAIGCLESLLLAQDSAAWVHPQTQTGPRRALSGLLAIGVDHRPKVRKRAQEAISKVLRNPPPSPSLDHPAADMCAESVLHSLRETIQATQKSKKGQSRAFEEHHPGLIHSLQLVKTIATASGGWPSRKIDALCEQLLNITKSSNEYLTMAAFDIFEAMLEGMAVDESAVKLTRLMEVITDLKPSQNDSQLLPPWIAILSRGYAVDAQLAPEDTFLKLPENFAMVASFLTSMSHNIRVSASECLVSFLSTCIPASAIIGPSVYDEKILEKVAEQAVSLLSVEYQSAWMEVFRVIGATFEAFKWRSCPILNEALKAIGELRENDSFAGKKDADAVIGKAIEAAGPENVLQILPLNLPTPPPGQQGRAWLLPILRDHIMNTNLRHFRSEFIPLSEVMFQRVLNHGDAEKTTQVRVFETVVSQVWSLLPGYCMLPLDLVGAFDKSLAEQASNILYQMPDLRSDVCRALQLLVDSNKEVLDMGDGENPFVQSRVSKQQARENIDHLATFAANLLAVLFNVYSQTLPEHRGYILQCINAYLSITRDAELMETFDRVMNMLEAALKEPSAQTQAEKQKNKQAKKVPPTTHTLMDLVITLAIYLPRARYQSLFTLARSILGTSQDMQMQKKAYKLIPRLSHSETGVTALEERNEELQELLLDASRKTPSPRRDRLEAMYTIIQYLPPSSLHFIPSVLPEVVISSKEVNEKARSTAFDILVQMGRKMQGGGTVTQSKVQNMPSDAPDAAASLEEYFTMVSAGLAGTTPHMISASIVSLTRILYEFAPELSHLVLEDLVSTISLFLTSTNREIVRSCLGFVKVAIISLPEPIIRPRLENLIPGLMTWSHEHNARFRMKVKHILERIIRRFGFDVLDRHCPEKDKKFIQNIRKTKERNRRKKEAGKADGENDGSVQARSKGRFDNEFDEAVYGSGSDSEHSEEGGDDLPSSDENSFSGSRGTKKGRSKTYIVEEDEEPLDLLDRKALGNISSTKPLKARHPPTNLKKKAKVDLDGKLVFRDDEADDDDEVMEFSVGGKGSADGGLEEGINSYVDAIRGRDVARRGRGGRLRFSNKRDRDGDVEMGGEDDVERQVARRIKESGRGARGGYGGHARRGSFRGARGGRIMKSGPRRRGGRR